MTAAATLPLAKCALKLFTFSMAPATPTSEGVDCPGGRGGVCRGEDGGGREQHGARVGGVAGWDDGQLEADGGRGIPPFAVQLSRKGPETEIDVLPEMNSRIGEIGSIEVDVDRRGIEASRIPRDGERFTGVHGLPRGWGGVKTTG